jgi:hypothetical protein
MVNIINFKILLLCQEVKKAAEVTRVVTAAIKVEIETVTLKEDLPLPTNKQEKECQVKVVKHQKAAAAVAKEEVVNNY